MIRSAAMTLPMNFPVFLTVTILALVMPGPDFLVVTRNAIARGVRSGMLTTFGIVIGHIIFSSLAVTGLAGLLAASEAVYAIVKVAGAVYLLYLGALLLKSLRGAWLVRNMRDVPASSFDSGREGSGKARSSFQQGLFSCLLNPKTLVFYAAFLPQFAEGGDGATLVIAELGVTVVVLAALWWSLCVWLTASFPDTFRQGLWRLVVDGAAGVALVGVGVGILVTGV